MKLKEFNGRVQQFNKNDVRNNVENSLQLKILKAPTITENAGCLAICTKIKDEIDDKVMDMVQKQLSQYLDQKRKALSQE